VGRGRMTAEDVKKYMFQPIDAAASGSIWVIAGGTNRIFSLFGDLIAMACKRNGMAGAVTDNGCRDIAAIRDVEFPVFAKASVPFGPSDFIRPVGGNVPVVCGGVTVNPGDWVAADLDGVIVIPKDDLRKVIEAANVLLAKEEKVRGEIESGVALVDAYNL
jgi:4-hydroxy-4-methyl-2-oxoglutarate aldolase